MNNKTEIWHAFDIFYYTHCCIVYSYHPVSPPAQCNMAFDIFQSMAICESKKAELYIY